MAVLKNTLKARLTFTRANFFGSLCKYKVTLPMVTNFFGTFQFGTVWQEKRGGKRKPMKFKVNCQKNGNPKTVFLMRPILYFKKSNAEFQGKIFSHSFLSRALSILSNRFYSSKKITFNFHLDFHFLSDRSGNYHKTEISFLENLFPFLLF